MLIFNPNNDIPEAKIFLWHTISKISGETFIWTHDGQGKKKISVHLLRSTWLISSNLIQVYRKSYYSSSSWGKSQWLLQVRKLLLKKKSELAWKLGWALWNRNSFEFKFDDTRLSSYYKNKIGPIKFFLLHPDFANSLPCWLSQTLE